MDISRIVKIFYIVYTVYILLVIDITSLTFAYILPAILIMWFNYLAFSFGFHIVKNRNQFLNRPVISYTLILKLNKFLLILIAGVSIACSLLAVKFYTGQSPISILESLRSNVSLYSEYQAYFSNQQLGIFSISKLPYIFMMFFTKFIMYYSYIAFLYEKEKSTLFDKIFIILVTIPHLYIAVARGTNFEYFELLILIIFIMLIKNRKRKISAKLLVRISILACLMLAVFYFVVLSRGFNFGRNVSNDVLYDQNGILPSISPFISFVVTIVYSYFGFGFFYISTYVNEIWLSSLSSFIDGLVPFGYLIANQDSISARIPKLIEMGARWHPDTTAIISSIGYLGLIFLCFMLGIFGKSVINMESNRTFVYMVQFMILLQLISLPVGNFILVSSSNKLIVAALLAYWLIKALLNNRKIVFYHHPA